MSEETYPTSIKFDEQTIVASELIMKDGKWWNSVLLVKDNKTGYLKTVSVTFREKDDGSGWKIAQKKTIHPKVWPTEKIAVDKILQKMEVLNETITKSIPRKTPGQNKL